MTFDGSDPDHDLRNVTFVGDVRDYTRRTTAQGTMTVERFSPKDGTSIQIALMTQLVVIEPQQALRAITIAFPVTLTPLDGWMLRMSSTQAIENVGWPAHTRFARLPRRLAADAHIEMVYARDDDCWLVI